MESQVELRKKIMERQVNAVKFFISEMLKSDEYISPSTKKFITDVLNYAESKGQVSGSQFYSILDNYLLTWRLSND